MVAESEVLRVNICAEKPAHRKSANRYQQGEEHTTTIKTTSKQFDNNVPLYTKIVIFY